jgi:PHD/YefM family antitoxin component YafN of YafNO toxin-antitoxin module
MQPLQANESYPLADFLRDHESHIARIHETRAPEVLTVDGRASVVLLDAETYESILDRIYHVETVEAIREGIASADRGELKPVEQVLAEMKAR